MADERAQANLGILRRLGLGLWYLLPANPILVRVVFGASRRPRHLWLRTAYLTALAVVILFASFDALSGTASLTDLAKGASRTFQWASTTQLALMCFLAPVFTAGAITQERDSQTLNILLSTPLTDAQIVFGSLMSRLYFVLMLLLAGLPIFLMTMVYGGVTRQSIFESFALSGSTAALTGALAIFIAMLGVGTRRTMFSFYLLIAFYLLIVFVLGTWPRTWVDAAPAGIDGRKMSFLAPLHPFLSLEVSLNRVSAPPHGHLAEYPALVRYALAYPSSVYVTWTTLAAIAMTLSSLLLVRRGSKVGEPTWLDGLLKHFRRASTGERTRRPRSVWHNPVAWREAKTRAAGSVTLRWTVIVAGAIASGVLLPMYLAGALSSDEVRQWLAGLIATQFGVALLIAANTSATALTKEKESKSLDLLLTTPLTSKYILWGKLRGLVSFAVPLLAVPVGAALVFGLMGIFRDEKVPVTWIECGLELAVLMVVYTAAACVIGLRVSMTARKNVSAVMYSVGALILGCTISWAIVHFIVTSVGGEVAALFAPFAPFTSVLLLTNPRWLFDTTQAFENNASGARVAALIGTLVATGVYAFAVWNMYTALVKGFDMTMRKQTGT